MEVRKLDKSGDINRFTKKSYIMRTFPTTRLRRNRTDKWLRDLLKEYYLTENDLILPLFVCDGDDKREEIKTLPGVFRLSIDNLLKEIEIAIELGIKAVALFPVVEQSLKSYNAEHAYDEQNLICRCVRKIKRVFSDQIGVITDVALDPYNLSGHDGVVIDGKVDNDKTLEILSKQALVLAEAGADIIAPSDMMDGRVGYIRNNLDKQEFQDVKILSYAVKYASNFYGPFRDAIGSDGNLKGKSKETYQMSFTSSSDAISEVELDLQEGADIIMVKPAMAYLDIINMIKAKFNVGIFAYHVSGEYAYLKAAAEKGYLDYDKTLYESLIACKRAGASAIFCYDSIRVAKLIRDKIFV